MKCVIWSLLLLSVLPWASWGQSEPSLQDNLETLGGLLESIEQTNERQQERLNALDEQLKNSESESLISKQAITDLQGISEAQGEYLRSLQWQLGQWQRTSEAQLRYSKQLKTRSTVLTISLAVGIPTAAALGAWMGWTLAGR
jgi:hypothetical protein